MQTHGRSAGTITPGSTRITGVLICSTMLASLASCTAPHLEALDTALTPLSDCESAYEWAEQASARLADTKSPVMVRYISASEAPESWLGVAASCSQRFSEGGIRSAQSLWGLMALGRLLGVSGSAGKDIDLGGLKASGDAEDMFSAMALAEDRAGFSMEILAARGAGDRALKLSDEHKTTAQQLISASGAQQDPREKEYAVGRLLADPVTITDDATGLTVPTTAAVEISCAREELAAMPAADGRWGCPAFYR